MRGLRGFGRVPNVPEQPRTRQGPIRKAATVSEEHSRRVPKAPERAFVGNSRELTEKTGSTGARLIRIHALNMFIHKHKP